jgi:hypothetical protein
MAHLSDIWVSEPIGDGQDVQTPIAEGRQGVGGEPSGRLGFIIDVMTLFITENRIPGARQRSRRSVPRTQVIYRILLLHATDYVEK